MSFHLHIFNLRHDVSNKEIRRLFPDLSIESDGVTVVGGPGGEAFVTFNNGSDLIQAMRMDGEQNLEFRIATDVEKLKGINSMCTAKLQNMKNTSGFSQSDTSYDAKRRKTDYDTHYVNEYPHGAQLPHLSQEEQKEQNPSTSQPYHPNQFNKRPMPFPSQAPVRPGPSDSNVGNQGGANFDPDPMPPWKVVPHPSRTILHGSPAHPHGEDNSRQMQFPSRHPLPESAFSTEVNLNPSPMPQQQPLPKLDNSYQGSLLMSLLPESKSPRYCIKVSDLPADVTPSMVWSWVGGREGTALGVVLLNPTNDEPVAFLVYDNEFECEQMLKFSTLSVVRFSVVDTCQFIATFIKNWTMLKGTAKHQPPIQETTWSGIDRFVNLRLVHVFLKNSFVKKKRLPPTYPSEKIDDKKNSLQKQMMPGTDLTSTLASDSRQSIVIYLPEPTVTSTEVLSWCIGGISAIKMDFHGKNGPRDSEALGFTFFHDRESRDNACVKLTEKDLSTGRRTFRSAYNMIAKYGSNCTMTETTADGERVVSLEERQKPPFVDEVKMKLYSDESFILNQKLKYICLTDIAPNTMPKVLWHQYPRAMGIIVMRQLFSLGAPGNRAEGIIAFKNVQDQNHAINRSVPTKICAIAKHESLNKLNCQDAMAMLARMGFEIKVSTYVGLSDRNITLEEAKFIIKQKSFKGVKPISTQTPIEENPSFIHHLKTPRDSSDGKPLCLRLLKLKENVSACKVHSLFPDALCALTVQFNGDGCGPFDSKAIAYLLLRDFEQSDIAKLVFRNCVQVWRCSKLVDGFSESHIVLENVKLIDVEEFLSRISYTSTICESSPEGDKVLTMEELAVAATMPPFSLAPGSPCLHYVQLTGIKEHLSACEVWSWFGGRHGKSKGVVLPVRKTDGKGCIAYVAFDSFDNREKLAAHPDARLVGNWIYIFRKSEQEILDVFARSSDDYVIKISTESGRDRDLEPAEEKLLGSPKMRPADTRTTIEEQTIHQDNGEHPEDKQVEKQDPVSKEDRANEQAVKGKSSSSSKEIKQEFYIRLKKVPTGVKTASDILLLFSAGGRSRAKSATLVRDSDGDGVCAYVMFDELEQRDSALSEHQFSVRCTGYGRAVRLAEFEPDHEISECTDGGHDRVLSMEERDSLEEFNEDT